MTDNEFMIILTIYKGIFKAWNHRTFVHDIVSNRKKGDMLCHPEIRIQVLICMRQENE